MAELLNLEDMTGGHLDTQTLKEAVNEDKWVTSRLGKEYASVPMASRLFVENGLLGATPYPAVEKMITEGAALADESYAVVTNDTGLKTNGFYQKIDGEWEQLKWNPAVQSQAYTDDELSVLDALNINSGKTYPLSYLQRSSVASDLQNQYFVASLLDAQVINAERGYYYKLSYLQNGETISNVAENYGVIVERINAETGETIRLIDYSDTTVQVRPDRAKGGVQDFVLRTYQSTYIKLTFDVDHLPSDGTPIIARAETNFGYNSIISPTCYIYEPTEIYQQISDANTSATAKADDAKTQAVAIATDLASDDATSKANAALAAAAIDANAKADSAKDSAISVAAIDADIKASAAKEAAILTAYSNDKSIKGFASNIGRYELADYYSDLGEGGQKLSLYTSFDDSVIAPVVATLNDTQVYIELDLANKSLTIIWRHTPSRLMQTVWQPNGFNNLFNFKSISYSDNPSLFNNEWVSIQDITTDYIPPLTFKATTQPITETGVSTAGGNHSANGAKTADMTACQFYIGGKLVTADFKGVVDSIQARWTNKIFAPNTVVEQRYTIQQDVLAEFSHAHIAVTVKTTALEPVNITYEGGTQMYAKGWLDATSFYGGEVKGFTPNVTEYIDAGTKSVAPNAWAVVVKSNDLGYFASYLDRGFGVKTDLIPPDGVMAARNNGTIPKYYNFTIRNQSLNTGDTYLWRGGYAYAPLSISNLESAFLAKLGGKDAIGYEALIGQKGEIKLPNQLIGKDFAQLSSSPTGVYVNATQYQTSLSKEV